MKRLIITFLVCMATYAATAQKGKGALGNPAEAAQIKAHSNQNNNREAGNAPKIAPGIQGAGNSGTKKKFDFGKWIKRK
ncbi:MAG: hypothetical protein ACYDCN_10285 [Bacteroidia bacterium]